MCRKNLTDSYRDTTIDILRGFAIFTMIAANMAASVLAHPHPFLFRLYGSFAAPLFIFLSGMMVTYAAQKKEKHLNYFILRGAMIIAIGAIIDLVIWNIYPFTTVDVLYLIGISLPLAYLFQFLKTSQKWLMIIPIFSLTPILQETMGYTSYPTECYLEAETDVLIPNQTNIFNHWIIDGWFPLFPWLGFSLLGAQFAGMRWKEELPAFIKKHLFFIGFGAISLGCTIWWIFPGSLLIREGYSELFYQPTIGFVISAVGLILLLFYFVDKKPSLIIYKPLKALGESSLFMYLFHLILIVFVIDKFWLEENLQTFLLIYFLLTSFLMGIAYALRKVKSKWKNCPFIIRFILGG